MWVWGDSSSPGLAMTWSIGDFTSAWFGVISEAEIFERQLTEKDMFCVIATDGVWELLSNEEIGWIVQPFYN